ncbi:MAG: NAD(P)H-dependent oxidoreductase subunit E, partial [Candidatus Zixiibacteriota bacterium]
MNSEEVAKILERHKGEQGELISVLEEIQAKYSYLPQELLRAVAEKTGRSMTDVYGVATFYKAFTLKPRGKHLVSVCLGTACHVRGGPSIAIEIQNQLGVGPGETTPDREFTLETVNCLGACAIGPVVVVDGHYFSNVKTSQVRDILEKSRKGLDIVEIDTDERVFPIQVSCARCNHSLMDTEHVIDGHPSIRVTVACGQNHGWVRISSLWGSYIVHSQHEIPYDSIVDFFC